MLSKTPVHLYSGSNVALGTAAGKLFRVGTLTIVEYVQTFSAGSFPPVRLLWPHAAHLHPERFLSQTAQEIQTSFQSQQHKSTRTL